MTSSITHLGQQTPTTGWRRLAALFVPDSRDMPSRRIDLDWLRILVFGLLILFHLGMFYTANWGWHVKSRYLSESLESLMLLSQPWRMACLWLISGVAIRFVLAKVPLWQFVGLRSLRLLLPLLFAIWVVVPPQLYFEMRANGDMPLTYWQFYQAFFDLNHPLFTDYRAGIYPHVDVNHLWYLRELWQYSLGLLLVAPLLNTAWVTRWWQALLGSHALWVIALLVLPVWAIQMTTRGDDTREYHGMLFLVYGYLLGWQPGAWQRLRDNANALLAGFVMTTVAMIAFYNGLWLGTGEGLPYGLRIIALEEGTGLERGLGLGLYSFARLLGVLTVLALAARFLNRDSAARRYLSEAVYPYYILHQSVIVVAGALLSPLALGPVGEPVLVMGLTLAACGLGYELIRRTEPLRPLFGLKLTGVYSPIWRRVGYGAAAVILLPFALQILSLGF